MTRFEINTYVKNQYNETGTLILDYLCNELSMDPVNLLKQKIHYIIIIHPNLVLIQKLN